MSAKGGANLPLARVKTIMKSSPEVENVNQESLFLVTRATVSFYKSQFRKRQFVRDKNTQKNASKFAIEKQNKLRGLSFSITVANFEAFRWVFLSQTNCLFLNCVPLFIYILLHILIFFLRS